MRRVTFILLILLVSAIPRLLYSADKTTNGVVEGKAFLSKEGSSQPLSNAIARLRIYRHQKEIAGSETRTNTSGIYRFRNMENDPFLSYQVTVIHNGSSFSTRQNSFSPTKSKLTFEDVFILPTTGDTKHLKASEVVVVEFGKQNMLKIGRSLRIANIGSETYDSEATGGSPIEIRLPKGGHQLEFHQGLTRSNTEIDSEGSRLLYSGRVKPGPENEIPIEFSYLYKADKRQATFLFPLAIERSKFSLVLREKNYTIKSKDVLKSREEDIKGVKYYLYEGGPFKANKSIDVTISGFLLSKDIPYGLLFLGIFLVLAAGGYLSIKQSKRNRNLKAIRESYLEMLCHIEEQRRDGNIQHEQYLSEQTILMEGLFELELQQNNQKQA